MTYIFGTLSSLLLIMAISCAAHGGECTFSEEINVLVLEGNSPGDAGRAFTDLVHCFYCLRYQRHTESNRWAGAITAAYFQSRRESPLRDRIKLIGEKYLAGPQDTQEQSILAHEAALTLAHYGIAQAGGYDIFSIISADTIQLPLVELAALNDPRTVKVLEQYYKKARVKGLDDIRNKDALISVLNCLYHISGAEAFKLAEAIAADEADPFLIERAKRIVNRGVH